MSGVVSFYWLDSEGDAHYMRIPRDEVRGVRYDGSDIEIHLVGSYQDINIVVDPSGDMDRDIERKLSTKMIDTIRALTDEDISWEWNGDKWEKLKSKNHDVWGKS